MEVNKIIIKPTISERSLKGEEAGKYVFEVAKAATKKSIAKAMKEKFGVDVVKVQTRLVKGRSRRMTKGRSRVKIGPIKRATIQLVEGQKLAIFEGKK
ncbi:MAG: 50S ribosomal protein L23 [Candidatus Woykebacteria bacterium]